MTVSELLIALQTLPRDAELLAFEAGCEEYCEREVDDYLEPDGWLRPAKQEPPTVPELPGGAAIPHHSRTGG
jgi:hypothetical protein